MEGRGGLYCLEKSSTFEKLVVVLDGDWVYVYVGFIFLMRWLASRPCRLLFLGLAALVFSCTIVPDVVPRCGFQRVGGQVPMIDQFSLLVVCTHSFRL